MTCCQELRTYFGFPSEKEFLALKENVATIENMRLQVKALQETEIGLQAELLEYYGLKEQEKGYMELENKFKRKCVDCFELNTKLQRLQELNAEEVVEASRLKVELSGARELIKELQEQISNEKTEVLRLQQLEKLRENEHDKNLQALKELEIEAVELRRTCRDLQHQKRELIAANEDQTSNIAASDFMMLKAVNEDLLRQIEGLQNNRFSEVEELVYLRWVNACLRYELRNVKATEGKVTALNLNRSLSPNSQEKAKQLMLEYAGPDFLALRSKEQKDSSGYESASSNLSSSSWDFSGPVMKTKRSGFFKRLKNWSSNRKCNGTFRSKDNIIYGGDSKHVSDSARHRLSNSNLEKLMIKSINKSGVATESSLTCLIRSPDVAPIKLVDCPSETEIVQAIQTGETVFPMLEKPDSLNSIAASFQLMSRSVSCTDIAEKYPAYRDRHKLAAKREKVIKEKVKEVAASKRSDSVDKMAAAEVESRNVRKAKPPPKPSSSPAAVPALGGGRIPLVRTSFGGGGGAVPPPPPPPGGLPLSGVPGAPPPPPPLPGCIGKPAQTSNRVQRAPQVVEFYQSLMKRGAKKEASMSACINSAEARDNMIGEIENRSTHLLAGEFVNSIAAEIRAAVYTNIDDVVAFVNWLDEELSFLVDERAVLKHFDWPEAKADALREAAFDYQDLKKLEAEIAEYEDDHRVPRDTAFKQMLASLEKVEQSVYALLRTRDMVMARYKEFSIPTYWMLDSGLIGKIKLASVKLAQQYMKRVVGELDAVGNRQEREPLREFLMLQGVRFAFRTHQFAGGFDPESMQAFEELRGRARSH